MALSEHDFRWFATRLMVEVYDINARIEREREMAAQVHNLAESVRKMKEMMAKVSTASAKLQTNVENVSSTLATVDQMNTELEATHAELQAAVGQLSNGGPPMNEAPADKGLTAAQAAAAVSAANR